MAIQKVAGYGARPQMEARNLSGNTPLQPFMIGLFSNSDV
jgi:hypothetical protein